MDAREKKTSVKLDHKAILIEFVAFVKIYSENFISVTSCGSALFYLL